VAGHRPDGSPYPGRWRNHPELAAAGLWSSPSDLARFAMEVRRAANGEPGKVLSAEMARLMVTRQKGDYGRGLQITGGSAERGASFQHAGANPGYRGLMVCRLDSGDGAVILTNGDGGSVLVPEILRSIAREYGWKGFAPTIRTVVTLEASQLGEYAGRYAAGDSVLKVEREGDRLYISAPDLTGGRWQLRPLGRDRFLLAEEDEEVTFARNERGQLNELRTAGEAGRAWSARRMPN
jgi:hypothetical protein